MNFFRTVCRCGHGRDEKHARWLEPEPATVRSKTRKEWQVVGIAVALFAVIMFGGLAYKAWSEPGSDLLPYHGHMDAGYAALAKRDYTTSSLEFKAAQDLAERNGGNPFFLLSSGFVAFMGEDEETMWNWFAAAAAVCGSLGGEFTRPGDALYGVTESGCFQYYKNGENLQITLGLP